MKKSDFQFLMSRHFPVQSHQVVEELIQAHNVQLRMVYGRNRSFGYFRPATKRLPDCISINGELNVFSSLLIFLHEYAHLLNWKAHGKKVPSHGAVWKELYGKLIRRFVELGCFHPSLDGELVAYSYKVIGRGLADEALTRALLLFDEADDGLVFVSELPPKSRFSSRDGKRFVKLHKLRKRFICQCEDNKRMYSFNPLARVLPLAV